MRPPRFGMVGRALAAWPRFRAAMARELAARPPESRLFAYLMVGCVVLLVARLPALATAARGMSEEQVAGLAAANLAGALIFAPLLFYAAAALMRLILRAFGGTGGWYETRLAVFWSLVAAAPALLLGAAAGLALTRAGMPGAAWAASQAAGAVWLWIWSAFLAEAHGLRSPLPLFAAVAAAALILAALGPAGG